MPIPSQETENIETLSNFNAAHIFHQLESNSSSSDGSYEITMINTRATVYSTGSIVWNPPSIWAYSCVIDVVTYLFLNFARCNVALPYLNFNF